MPPAADAARQLTRAVKSHKKLSNLTVTLPVMIRLVGFEKLCPIKPRCEFNCPEKRPLSDIIGPSNKH